MKTYARLQDQVVVELFATDQHPSNLFNSALTWVEVTSGNVAPGWRVSLDGTTKAPTFTAPPPETPPAHVPPSLADLQAELAVLNAKFAALTSSNKAGG